MKRKLNLISSCLCALPLFKITLYKLCDPILERIDKSKRCIITWLSLFPCEWNVNFWCINPILSVHRITIRKDRRDGQLYQKPGPTIPFSVPTAASGLWLTKTHPATPNRTTLLYLMLPRHQPASPWIEVWQAAAPDQRRSWAWPLVHNIPLFVILNFEKKKRAVFGYLFLFE